jgi:hypothetical protein
MRADESVTAAAQLAKTLKRSRKDSKTLKNKGRKAIAMKAMWNHPFESLVALLLSRLGDRI